MRPLRLEFQAFGSYPGKHVIDFEALGKRGLFVVTGPTGTGKTTVFDAMVYALFGALPGSRSSDGDPRSHHAAADMETFVTLDFEVDGTRYRVHRTPRWDRPKQRGTGTTAQQPTAVVSTMAGDSTTALATQATTTTKKCEELVGLDGKQFQRVVLLPQGKFTDFLIATDENREQLLRQLFGGELFEEATKLLRRQMDDLDGQVKGVDIDVQHHRSNAVAELTTARRVWLDAADRSLDELSDSELEALVDELQPVRVERKQVLAAVQAAATTATEAKTAAGAAAARFDEAARATGLSQTLEQQREAIRADEHAAEASRRARPVQRAAANATAAQANVAAATARLDETRDAVIAGFAALGRPMPGFDAASVAAAVEGAAKHYDEQQQLLRAAKHAAKTADATDVALGLAADDHQTLVDAVGEQETAAAALRARVIELDPLAASVDLLDAARTTAEQHLKAAAGIADAIVLRSRAQHAAEDAKSAYVATMARFIDTQAPLLAATLRDGDPCPVCGSAEHPAPARHADGEVVDHDTVDAARERWTRADAEVAAHSSTIDTLRASLGGHADDPVETFEAALAAASESLKGARRAAAELNEIRARIVTADVGLATAKAAERTKSNDVVGLTSRAATERAEAARLAQVAAGIDADELAEAVGAVAALKATTADIASRFDAVTSASAALSGHEQRLAEELTASTFVDVQAAARELLDERVENELFARIATWNADVDRTAVRLQQLAEQGVPAERPDVAGMEIAADEANDRANAAREEFVTASNALDAAATELSAAASIAAGSAELRRHRDVVRTVFKTCNGEAGIRVKLERWVLAGELDRVTSAANVHLATMTNHRYTLSRSAASKGGLTLEVFDAHTGRSRPTASLSGGEQFQASLSLALGLADVVSHGGTASGKQFEALFVDEGFGSLDPDALDDAIRALSMLHATGRMVGAITHVEAMKQQLHVGIEVKALADGRGSTLVVNP